LVKIKEYSRAKTSKKLTKKKFTLHKNDKKWRLVEYVEGKTFSGTLKEFKNTTKTIAKLSNILSKYPKKKTY
jgi:hypothetical protein